MGVFPFEAVLPPPWMSTKQIPIFAAGVGWKVRHWNFFISIFSWQIRRSTCYICYLWKWTIQLWNLSSCLEIVLCFQSCSQSCHAALAGHGKGFRLTMLPLCTLFIALPPSNETSFALWDKFGKSALLWSLNQETSLEKNPLMGWLLCLKCVISWGNEEQISERSLPQ